MEPGMRHQILDQLVSTCHLWLSCGYKPGHGRDKLQQIYGLWKPAWDEGLVQDRSMSMDNMTEDGAKAYCLKYCLPDPPRELQELLEEISLVWFSFTFLAEQQEP